MNVIFVIDEIRPVLNRLLASGGLTRIPRNPAHRDLLLAIVAQALRRRYPYSEVELNALLQEELARFNTPVDHVTCRRYLVDCGFVKRDAAGVRYLLNYPKLESVLSEEARAAVPELLATAFANAAARRARSDAPPPS